MTSIGSILLLLPAIALSAKLEKRYWEVEPEVHNNSGTNNSFFQVESGSGDFCNCGLENTPTSKILGGSETFPNQYPWMVRLLSGCGGSLISDRHVLTAYHCVYKGKVKLAINDVVKVSVHNQYNSSDYETVPVKDIVFPPKPYLSWQRPGVHDIAIIILARSVNFDDTKHPVCLPGANTGQLGTGLEPLRALGWGNTGQGLQSPTLKQLDMTVAQTYSYNNNRNYFETGRLETGEKNCDGDSGGPLVHQDAATKRWTIMGTAHAVYVNGQGEVCVSDAGRVIWNKVQAHIAWINKVLDGTPKTARCAPQTTTCPHEDKFRTEICQEYKEYCINNVWANFMAKFCAKTCKC